MEVWRAIPGFEEYSVSSAGRIRRGTTILRPALSTKRGRTVGLYVTLTSPSRRKTFYVRRLVALAFVPNAGRKNLVVHRNGNRRDCRAANLRWTDKRELALNIRKGTSVMQIDLKSRRVVQVFGSMNQAAMQTGANRSSIRNVLNGIQHHAAGFFWKLQK